MQICKAYTASFDVDSQNTFTPRCPNELPVPEGDRIAEELNRQAQFAKLRVGSKDAHPRNAEWLADDQHPVGSPIEAPFMDTRWPVHAVPGTLGFELIAGLPHPGRYDFFVWKGVEPDMHPYGACYHDLEERLSTGAIEFLHREEIRTVLVGGLATDYCVKHTVLQLSRAGFEVILNERGCRGLSPSGVEETYRALEEAGVRRIAGCDELELIEPPEYGL